MRLRLRYTKLGRVRFIGQRDVARAWERALRRAGLPVAYSEGFSPRPRLGFGLALPTGGESLSEYVDVHLDPSSSYLAPGDAAPLGALLAPFLPQGIEVTAAVGIEGPVGSLQEEITSCSWLLSVEGLDPSTLQVAVHEAMSAGDLPVTRERKGRLREDDIRPSIRSLSMLPGPADVAGGSWGASGTVVAADLATRPRGVRPSELVAALATVAGADGVGLARVCRTRQWIEGDGARREPLAEPGHRDGDVTERTLERVP